MEGFTYTDIFETKGIEYLVIIFFLSVLILFWTVLNNPRKAIQQMNKSLEAIRLNLLRMPFGIMFSKNHTWAHLEKQGNAKIGLDDFLLKVLGEVTIGFKKDSGETIKKGEIIASIEQNGKRLNIYSPLSGQILHLNNAIMENPNSLHQDPYEKGWLYSVKPSNWQQETHNYYLAEEATQWIKGEIDRFKDFIAIAFTKHSQEPLLVKFQEGGELRQNILSEMDEKIWNDFQESFLDD